MLSKTDIHYITGVLYLVSGKNSDIVMLGERIFDVASGSKRDVDIVVMTAGSTAFLAVEVKDESRKLDVQVIEGICQKFSDMPTITTKAVVSTSGYTTGAIRKARSHQVYCLTLVRGAVPPFPHVDISCIAQITVCLPHWLQGPNIFLIGDGFKPEHKAKLTPATSIHFPSGKSPIRFAELQDRIVTSSLQLSGYEGSIGPKEIKANLLIDDEPTLRLHGKTIAITQALVKGIVERQCRDIPLSEACYLADESGQPFAEAAIVEVDEFLIGVATGHNSNALQIIVIPPRIRKLRPLRHKLNQ